MVEHAIRRVARALGQFVTDMEWGQLHGSSYPIAVERQGLRAIVIEIDQTDIEDLPIAIETRSVIEQDIRSELTRPSDLH